MKANQVNFIIMPGMKTNQCVCVIDTWNESESSLLYTDARNENKSMCLCS